MAEYIERKAAIRKINGEFPDAHYPSWYAALIEEIPAADVVEVVRCKDCKYGEKDTETADLWYLCKYDGCVLNYVNHYCGYGKRRASDG